MAYSTQFNNVFGSSKLTFKNFYTYVAEIQLPGNVIRSSPEYRVLATVLLWLAFGDFYHIM
jgi:hypothetical protein